MQTDTVTIPAFTVHDDIEIAEDEELVTIPAFTVHDEPSL
jgi:hypothetical protein